MGAPDSRQENSMNKRIRVAIVAGAMASFGWGCGQAIAGGDPVAGQTKFETCKACHGELGAKPATPDYPLLAGQHEDYIKHTLAAYKSKKRINVIMNAMAAALSKQDIADIAAYVSHQEGLHLKY